MGHASWAERRRAASARVSAVSAWEISIKAQALAEGLTIVTRGKRFSDYSVALLPA